MHGQQDEIIFCPARTNPDRDCLAGLPSDNTDLDLAVLERRSWSGSVELCGIQVTRQPGNSDGERRTGSQSLIEKIPMYARNAFSDRNRHE
jgi:hypothetical protein